MKIKFLLEAQAIIEIPIELTSGKTEEQIVSEFVKSYEDDIVAFICMSESSYSFSGKIIKDS